MRTRVSWREWLGIAAFATLMIAGAWTPSAAAAQAAHPSRTEIQFGYIARGRASPVQPVFVTNTGDAPLTISGISVTGARAADYVVSGECGPPISLAPTERCRIDVVLQSSGSPGSAVYADLVVTTNATPSTITVGLRGRVDPALKTDIFVPTPPWLDFTSQPVGSTSPPQTMTIANASSAPFTIEVFELYGGDKDDFALNSDCAPPMPYGAGQICTAKITFAPQAAGPRSTELYTTMRYLGVASGTVKYSVTGTGGSAPVALPVAVVEYYNASLDHYFITWLPAEQANLDAGNTPTRWERTGQSFRAYTTAQSGTAQVCRYYLPPQFGDSHYFGRDVVECNATGQMNPAFVLEDPGFMHVFLPAAGICPAGTTPVYRVFSNRADANHRYMVDRTLRDLMAAKGWQIEGDGPDAVVMCAPSQ